MYSRGGTGTWKQRGYCSFNGDMCTEAALMSNQNQGNNFRQLTPDACLVSSSTTSGKKYRK